MTSRVITAVIGIPVLLFLIYYGGVLLQIATACLFLLGLYEFTQMHNSVVYWDYLLITGLSGQLLAYTTADSSLWLAWIILQLLYYLVRTSFDGQQIFGQAWHVLAVFYLGLFSFLWVVYDAFGTKWVMYAFIITWSTDIFAYLIGLKFGKNKLAPNISPKKTIQGAFGGLVAAGICGIIFAVIFSYPVMIVAIISLVLSCIGQIGDLVESAMKRERAVKDSGKILPGHGGILDRFDSLLFVLPSLYIVLKYITVIA